MSKRQITGDDVGARVRILESHEHFYGGETGRVLGWSRAVEEAFEVRLDSSGVSRRGIFLARPGDVVEVEG
jgi:hypothetical protein